MQMKYKQRNNYERSRHTTVLSDIWAKLARWQLVALLMTIITANRNVSE